MRTEPHLDLNAAQSVDIRTVDPEILIDIRDTKIDTQLPAEERILDFIRQIQNPYCFKCGKTVVKISFSNTKATLEERMEGYLRSL